MIEGYYSGTTFAESMADWLPYKLEQLGLLNLLSEGPFVDFGCGLGTVIAALQQKYPGTPFIGIDRDKECLRKAREIVLPNTLLIQASLSQSPLQDDSAAIIFSHKIYQLCNEERYPEIAREIHRTLRTGGIYCALEDMRDYKNPFLNLGLIPIYENQSMMFRK